MVSSAAGRRQHRLNWLNWLASMLAFAAAAMSPDERPLNWHHRVWVVASLCLFVNKNLTQN